MLDEKDLQAIAEMLAQQKQEILDEVSLRMKALLDPEVQKRIQLIAEKQDEILRRLPSEEDMNIVDAASIFWRE